MSQIPDFATLDPFHGMIPEAPGNVHNLLDGSWHIASSIRQDIPDPLHGGEFLRVPDTTDVQPFIDSLARCPKTGLHNPWKQPQRYLMLGDVCARAAARLAEPAVEEYFVRLALVLDTEHAFEHDGDFLKIRALTGFDPSGGRLHPRHADAFVA